MSKYSSSIRAQSSGPSNLEGRVWVRVRGRVGVGVRDWVRVRVRGRGPLCSAVEQNRAVARPGGIRLQPRLDLDQRRQHRVSRASYNTSHTTYNTRILMARADLHEP